jgi:flagellar hook protein FlgE
MGAVGSRRRCAVSSRAVEGSNVDPAEEFVGLMEHQRAFAAHCKTTTTADGMLESGANVTRR